MATIGFCHRHDTLVRYNLDTAEAEVSDVTREHSASLLNTAVLLL